MTRALLAIGITLWAVTELRSEENTFKELVLTNAAQVRALSREDAANQLPVRLRGVVLGGTWDKLSLIDETAGIYLQNTNGVFPKYARGSLIVVEGFSDPGQFAPIVKVAKSRSVGRGTIPEARAVNFDDFLSGQLDSQWVRISGVVRRCKPPGEQGVAMWSLLVALGDGQLWVRLPKESGSKLEVDAEIEVSGVCFYQFNAARQALHPVLIIPIGEPVSIFRPAPEDPYSAPLHKIGRLMQFIPGNSYRHRVRVQGSVTHVEGTRVWITDEQRGLRVDTTDPASVSVGEEVDVLGFLSVDAYSPHLEDAVLQSRGSGQPQIFVHVESTEDVVQHDASLVELDATIREKYLTLDGCRLDLVMGTNNFSAQLRLASNQPAPLNWIPGSRVRVTGISQVRVDEQRVVQGPLEPLGFELLLRSPNDVLILTPAPWWTTGRISRVLGIVVGFLLLALVGLGWNHRRHLRQNTLAREKSEAEFAAILNERNRMAREIHDTLAQDLTAVSSQLEALRGKLPPALEPAHAHIAQLRGVVRSSLNEARRSIFNMRSQVLETGDLVQAFRELLAHETANTSIKGQLNVRGTPHRMSTALENDLLRTGQEAVHNAIRHGHPQTLDVLLEFGDTSLLLEVKDDGHGFDLTDIPRDRNDHFGLIGMGERAQRHGGKLTIDSGPGRGTKLSLRIPLK